jgi:drug/metabolite transporter (DMT)-like permease
MPVMKNLSVQGKGIALMVFAMLLVPLMDGTAKYLTSDYPVLQIVWARYAFHLLSLLPFIIWKLRPGELLPAPLTLQIIRALVLNADTFLFVAAMALIPLADGKAIFFAAPLVMTALAPLMLKETIGPRRIIAVVVGFIGALVIMRPDMQGIELGHALALGSAILYAIYMLLTRKVSGAGSILTTLAFPALVGTITLSFIMPFQWQAPDLNGWLLMLLLGALGAFSHYALIQAFYHSDAGTLAPFAYTEIISAVLFGLIVFDQLPDVWTWIGMAIVIASGLYVTFRARS